MGKSKKRIEAVDAERIKEEDAAKMGKSKKRVEAVDGGRVKEEDASTRQIAPVADPQLEYIAKISRGCSTMEALVELVSSFSESKTAGFLSRAEEKTKIKNRLLFLNSVYRDIAEPKHNHLYFSKLSVLLAQYIGLEVLTSEDAIKMERREGKDLISRIVTTLFTLLDKSEEHVLDTILRLKAPLEEGTPPNDVALYTLLFRMIVKRALKRQINDLIYIRYVLVCRLWKKLVKEDTREKERVIKFALKSLKPPPGFPKRRALLPKILPKPPKGTENITEFFLRERYNVRRTVQRFLEFSCKVANSPTMFPNLSCAPRLLNPKVREFGPIPPFAAPVQEFSTCQRLTEEVAWRLRCDDPPSEASLYEQVTRFKKIPQCTETRLSNLLHSHHIRDKPQKVKAKKRPLGQVGPPSKHAVGRIRNGVVAARRPPSPETDFSECDSPSVSQTNPAAVKSETWVEESHSIHAYNHYPRKRAFVLPFNGNSTERSRTCNVPEVQIKSEQKEEKEVKPDVGEYISKPQSGAPNHLLPEMLCDLTEPQKKRRRLAEENRTEPKAELPAELSSLNANFPREVSSDAGKPMYGFDAESLGLSLGDQSDVPSDPIWEIMEALDQMPADSLPAIGTANEAPTLPSAAAPLGGISSNCVAPLDRMGLLNYDEMDGVAALKGETDAAFWQADFAAYSMPGTASQWNHPMQPEFPLNPVSSHSLDPELDLTVDQLSAGLIGSAGLIDQAGAPWDDPLDQADEDWFREVFQSSAQSEMSNLLLNEVSSRDFK